MSETQITSTSPEATESYGERIGRTLKGGEIIELISDLGGGKTTFVRGIARGLGSSSHVSSPTFKISNIYKSSGLELHHFDFYRLNEAGIIADELAEVMGDPKVITIVEWGDIVHDVLPTERVEIEIKNNGETKRELLFHYPETLSYIVEGLR